MYLDITGRADNGYHYLETVMHSVALEDTVTIESHLENGRIQVACSDLSIPSGERNIAHKAALAFFKAAEMEPQGLKIYIDKKVPHGAGLGGGSADAAAVLHGLNEMHGSAVSPEALARAAMSVGADVPFCLAGGCALAYGFGERLTPLSPLAGCHIVIVKPAHGMDTREAYRRVDAYPGTLPAAASKTLLEGIAAGSLPLVGRGMYNVFETVQENPVTARIVEAMLCAGADGAALTGSGSAVAGIFSSEAQARHCHEKCMPDFQSSMMLPSDSGVYLIDCQSF